MFGAKLSGSQIVRVPNCPGNKLSVFNSWCQILRCQIVLQSDTLLEIRSEDKMKLKEETGETDTF